MKSQVNLMTTIQRIAEREYVVGQSAYLSTWQSYYRGDYNNLYYTIDNGNGKKQQFVKKSLSMPKKICNDLANYILNEKCDIVVPDSAQEKLNKFLQKENFWVKANANYEQAMALSIGAWVEGIDNMEVNEKGEMVKKGKLKMRYINATKIYPITIVDGEIVECGFASQNTNYTNVELHLLNEKGEYFIRNFKLDSKTFAIMSDITDFETHSNIPLFQLVYPNIANNIDINSQLPISVYANELDKFDVIDETFDDFNIEFKNGKRRILVNASLWRTNTKDGTVERTFDKNDTCFYVLEFEDNSKPLIATAADPLREQSYINAINTDLNLISISLGFGKDFYNFTGGGELAHTATEVISMASDIIRTIKKHEIVVEQALIGMVKAVQYLSNTFTDNPLGEFDEDDINIIFDDSAFDDKETEQLRDRTNVQAGLMSEVEYRMRWFAEDEESAKKYVWENLRYKLINNNLQALTGGAITPEIFVDICYGDKNESEKNEIIEYIKEQKKNNSLVPFEGNFEE